MATKAGVWIDHKQAIVVIVTNAGNEIKKIAFDIGQPVRSARSKRPKGKFTPNDYIAEDRLERKVENDRKDYYDDVIASLRGAAAILILGPGEAKGEFVKRINSKKLFAGIVEQETADKMSDRQLAAKVAEHFNKAPVRKSVAPQASKKAMSGERARKTAKSIIRSARAQ